MQTSLHIRTVWSGPLLFACLKVDMHMKSRLAKSKISILKLVSAVEQVGLNLTLSETPKTGFLMSRPMTYTEYNGAQLCVKSTMTLIQ